MAVPVLISSIFLSVTKLGVFYLLDQLFNGCLLLG